MEPPPGRPDVWRGMGAYLRGLDAAIGIRPEAVLVISGHWESAPFAINTAAHSTLLFDYYGFPEHTYKLTYPVSGSPRLAARARALLESAGIASAEEHERGLDHGVFVPFKLIYPAADVPIVQLSLHSNLQAAAHLQLGRALAPLRAEGVLIVGSGMSYHNLRRLSSEDPRTLEAAQQFDDWLNDAVADPDPQARAEKLSAWADAPGGREAHPTPEHLIPLMVAAGAAGADRGQRTYNERLMGKSISGFQFG
jgi:aromatic ring-opening dioxygenase catalytic subunit (LigB family)